MSESEAEAVAVAVAEEEGRVKEKEGRERSLSQVESSTSTTTSATNTSTSSSGSSGSGSGSGEKDKDKEGGDKRPTRIRIPTILSQPSVRSVVRVTDQPVALESAVLKIAAARECAFLQRQKQEVGVKRKLINNFVISFL